MTRLILRRLILILVLVPLLHPLGYLTAISIGVQRFSGDPLALQAAPRAAWLASYRDYLAGLVHPQPLAPNQAPTSAIVLRSTGGSLVLLGLALLVTVVVGIALSLAAIAPHTGRVAPRWTLLLTIGSALPGFFFGIVSIALVLIVSRRFVNGPGTIVPVQGYGLDAHLLLPVLTLASRPTFYIARIIAGLLEHELQQDYVRVARSKGVAWRSLVLKHAFPNIVSAVAVALGQSMFMLITELIIVETMFDWPGIGRTLTTLLGIRPVTVRLKTVDGPAVLAAATVVFGTLILLAEFGASLLAHWADPRLRAVTNASKLPAIA